MGNILSYIENVEEDEEVCEVVEVVEEDAERVILTVIEDVAISEINKIPSRLEVIKECNLSPTHFSNLKCQLNNMPEKVKLKQYKSSELTKYYNLITPVKERRYAFYS